ncbi:MAG: hypothetical protein AAFR01_13600 [Pseudomonadota bacterium]
MPLRKELPTLMGLVTVMMTVAATAPAQAASCLYVARTADGQVWADGRASARRGSTACRRARRRCNRELGARVVRRGQPAGLRPCRKVTYGGSTSDSGARRPRRTNGRSKPNPNRSKPPSS